MSLPVNDDRIGGDQDKVNESLDNPEDVEPLDSLTMCNYHQDKFMEIPPEILEKILKATDPYQLLKCRLVNRTWLDLSSGVLKKAGRDQLKIQFSFCYGSNEFVLAHGHDSSDSQKKPKTLKDFNLCLSLNSSSLSFPCPNFTLMYGPLDHPDLSDLLDVCGFNMTSLTLYLAHSTKDECPSEQIQILYKILNCQAPKLKNLILSLPEQLLQFKLDSSKLPALTLPSLDSLDINLDARGLSPLVQQVLKSSKNLAICQNSSHVDGYVLDLYFPFFMEISKAHTIQSLQFSPRNSRESLQVYEKLAQVPFKLQKICISLYEIWERPQFWLKVGRALETILRASQDTLKKIELWHPIGFLWHEVDENPFKFPRVDCINISRTDGLLLESLPTLRLFPKSWQWSESFPRIDTMTLSFCPEHGDQLDNYLEAQGGPLIPLLRVTNLIIDNYDLMPKNLLEKAGAIFPQVKQLDINLMGDFSTGVEGILKYFKGIQILKLSLDVPGFEDGPREISDFYPNLDSAFLGVTKKVCKKLRKNILNGKSILEFERTGPSIVDLKELKELEFKLYDWEDQVKEVYRVLTPITGEFGFKKMREDLKIQILIDASSETNKNCILEGLKPMSPYAKIQGVKSRHIFHEL